MGSQAAERAHAHLESPESQLHPHFHALLSPKALSPVQDGAEASLSEALLGISSSMKTVFSWLSHGLVFWKSLPCFCTH